MKEHPSIIQNRPVEDLSSPNDDGCVLGTAGRDEDPNAATDWDHERDSAGNVPTPDDSHAQSKRETDQSKAVDLDTAQDNDTVD